MYTLTKWQTYNLAGREYLERIWSAVEAELERSWSGVEAQLNRNWELFENNLLGAGMNRITEFGKECMLRHKKGCLMFGQPFNYRI